MILVTYRRSALKIRARQVPPVSADQPILSLSTVPAISTCPSPQIQDSEPVQQAVATPALVQLLQSACDLKVCCTPSAHLTCHADSIRLKWLFSMKSKTSKVPSQPLAIECRPTDRPHSALSTSRVCIATTAANSPRQCKPQNCYQLLAHRSAYLADRVRSCLLNLPPATRLRRPHPALYAETRMLKKMPCSTTLPASSIGTTYPSDGPNHTGPEQLAKTSSMSTALIWSP